MTTMNEERAGFEAVYGTIKPEDHATGDDQAIYELERIAFQAGAAWQRTQAAGVPDVSAMAKVLSDRSADACNIDRTDNWAMYGQEYIEDVRAMLAAAPSTAREDARGWISVSERLPSVAQEVIVNSEFDGVTAGFLDSYGEWYAPNSDYKLTRVIAWQPFPPAPALAASTGQEVGK